MQAKAFARDLLPPILVRGVRALRGAGADSVSAAVMQEHPSWGSAAARASGYDAAHILELVTTSTDRVQSGEAAYERDSVAFGEVQHSYPLLAALLRAAAERNGALRVLDFGGSLGSSFRQCRPFLQVLRSLEWHVVEQPHFARRGRERFQTAELRFFDSVEDACADARPDVVLASGVLQYVQEPFGVLESLRATGSTYLVIDRTPMHDGAADRVVLQEVPPDIYDASYPCWIFARQKLLDKIGSDWQLLAQFPSAVDGPMATTFGRVELGGFILRRQPQKASSAP